MKLLTSVATLTLFCCLTESKASQEQFDITDSNATIPSAAYITYQNECIMDKLIEEPSSKALTLHFNREKDTFYRDFSSLEEAESYHKVLAQQVPEKIIGAQDRREILGKGVQKSEYNLHFYLEMTYAKSKVTGNARTYYGSGTLIDPSILITAGHNLYDDADGGYPDRIDCYAACYNNEVLGDATVFPVKTPKSVFVPQKYVVNKDVAFDIALIFFNRDTANIFNKKLSFATPLKNFNALPLDKITFYVTGYPGKRVAYSMGGKVMEAANNNRIKYDIDTEPGQSGSGVWFMSQGKNYCVGVHAYAGNGNVERYNLGTLITEEVAEEIKKNKFSVVK